jgi:glutathione synthase/RimK-type ligase-like ATP-grasp enzyme
MIINVLINYKKEFYSSIALMRENKLSMNFEQLKLFGQDYQIEFRFTNFHDISFFGNDFKDQVFLYTSSEDPGLLYKSYIEDVIMGLKLQGATLIPDLHLMHAHHNKVFMEMLRDIILKEIDTGISSQHFGTLEDFRQSESKILIPSVIKKSAGAASSGIAMLKTKRDLKTIPLKFSRSFNLKLFLKRILHIWSFYSNYRNKFIVQNFIPGLNGDFKILVYWDKYYILGRQTRKNDFRASGSGRFNFNVDVPDGILNFAEKIKTLLNVPVVSLDIAFNGIRFFLLEFQCLNFGTITLEKSSRYFLRVDKIWKEIRDTSIMEKEFVRSIAAFLNQSSVKSVR